MSRYVTQRREGQVAQQDPRPFRPMPPGRISPIDLPLMGFAIISAAWITQHVPSMPMMIAALAAVGGALGIISGALGIRRQRRASKPMVALSDQPFN